MATKQLSGIRQVFLDMDGTIYHGSTLFPTTIPFLNFLKEHNIGYTFLSNNSSYSKQEYVDRLQTMGIEVQLSDFYISTDYTIDYLHQFHPEIQRIFLLAMPAVRKEFEAAGFVLDCQNPQGVVIAFDRELTYQNLCLAAYFLRQDIPGFATHPDPYCPTDQKMCWLVDCGAVTKCLEFATGKTVKVLGKPDPGLLHLAAASRNVTPDQTIMCGDRLATDIRLGVAAGAMTCHIIGTDAQHMDQVNPDFSVKSLGDLHRIWQEQLQSQKPE